MESGPITSWQIDGEKVETVTDFRFVIAFLPWSQHLLISWLQSLSVVILGPKKTKSVTASTFTPSICHEVMGLDVIILVF